MNTSTLNTLIPELTTTGPRREFTALRADSRLVNPGDAFIALTGSIADGHDYVPQAITNGAAVVIVERGREPLTDDTTVVSVPDTREALRLLLPILYPGARRVRLVGITGTSGKTTTTYLLESIIRAAGLTPGVIGTVSIRYADASIDAAVTTPGPAELFATLDEMHRAGVDTCLMEVSSHALDQDRIMGLEFAAAVFTNLGQDHLDYHVDMDTYFHAKERLFGAPYLHGAAVINTDDPYGDKLAAPLSAPLSFGREGSPLIKLSRLHSDASGLELTLRTPAGAFNFTSPLVGAMHAYNIMAAFGVGLALELDPAAIIAGIENLAVVPGRMEAVPNPHGLTILVDYAHKPNALQCALEAARAMTPGRLRVIFGCGGDRDRGKRPLMGRIAAELADEIIITSDNPRSEDPDAIIADITAGIDTTDNVTVEPDRGEAIRLGIRDLTPEDCLLIAGKGHETYQIVGTEKLPFDDKACVRTALREAFSS